MSTRAILAVDCGTTSVKVGFIDRQLRLIAEHVEPCQLKVPAPGQAEQAPESWWASLARGLRKMHAGTEAQVEGIVFCAQMCGLVCADAQGRALRPALIWRDKRAAPDARALIGGWPAIFGYRVDKLARWLRLANGAPSRNGMDPIAKMRFILRHEPQVAARTAYFLDVRDWLLARATGRFATTADSANLTWLMDTRPGSEGWSPELARLSGINLARMPPILDGRAEVGPLTAGAASELGLASGIPVFAGCGDVTAAALGTGAVENGTLHVCLSTGAWIGGFFNRRVLSVQHAYATVASPFAYRPFLIAAQESAGGALGWGRTVFAGGTDWDAGPYADATAARPDDPFVFTWFAGERVPHDDERLRGAIVGLSEHHDAEVLRRALIEGVALNLQWAWEKVSQERGVQHAGPVPVIGGGALVPALVQAVADAIGRDLCLGEGRLAGAVGAGLVGAAALGWVPDLWSAAADRAAASPHLVVRPTPEGRARMKSRGARMARLRRHLVRASAELGES